MAASLSKHRAVIETLYEDRATISRHVPSKDPTTKETKLVPETVYTDQPCRISQTSLASNSQTEAQNDIRYESKLFIAPEIVIRQGDVLEVTGRGMTRSYTAGEPFLYSTHQEISLQRKDYA
jgi:hypothetical protein